MYVAEDAAHVSDFQRVDGEDNNDYFYLGKRTTIDKAYAGDVTKVVVRTYFPEHDTYEWVTYGKKELLHMELSADGHYNMGHNIPTETISYVVSNRDDDYRNEDLVVAFITNTYVDNSSDDKETFSAPTWLESLTGNTDKYPVVRNADTSYKDGHIILTSKATSSGGYDTSIGFKKLNVDTSVYGKIRIRMKAEYTPGDNDYSQLFFLRSTDSSFDERHSYRFDFENNAAIDNEGWMIVDIDLTGYSRWNGIIKEIRFDPTNANAVYTFDYIRFIKTSDYKTMTDDELKTTYSTATGLLADNHFENGFDVRPIVNNYSPEGYFEYTGSGDETNNVWAICPWWTHSGNGLKPSNYSDTSLIHNRAETDEYTIADKKGSKVIQYHPDDKSLTMTLNGSKIYDGEAHIKDDPSTTQDESNRKWWPHLLIEQDPTIYEVDKAVHSAAADRVICELDLRMTDYKPTTNTEGTNACQYLVYFYLFGDKIGSQRIWFGIGLFDDRGSILYNPTWNRDSAGNQFIYCVPQETAYKGIENSFIDYDIVNNNSVFTPVPSNEWKTLRVDLTPHIDRAIEWANRDNAFGVEVTKEDLYFGGVNLGFETHGNVDCSFDIRNFNLVSYNY